MSTYNYHCFNTTDREGCNTCSNKGQVLTGEEAEFQCPCSGEPLKLLGQIPSGLIKTPTSNSKIQESRKKRNKEHFIKKDLPTISDPDAKRHHVSKLGYKS